MDAFLPRALTRRIERALELFPVVVVTGARQTGKSTLMRASFPHRRYVTMDAASNREIALSEPRTLLGQDSGDALTIDEIQRVPELMFLIKEAVDARRRNGRFLLTGSANLLLLRSVAESLAGRARYLTLWPMTRREQLGLADCGKWSDIMSQPQGQWPALLAAQDVAVEPWQHLAKRGGYPAAALMHGSDAADSDRSELFAGYTQTYLERDLRDLAAVDSLVDFQRLMRAACLRLGNVLNQAELGRDTGIPRTTVQRYLNLLEIAYQLIRIEPYSVNRTKRLVKSPKMYWSDTGLAMYLAGTSEPGGPHLENMVLTDLLAWRETQTQSTSILYWRTQNGEEVDFVIEQGNRLLGIEVKASTNPGYKDARGLRAFLQEYADSAIGGLLLHDGAETHWLSEGVLAVPWWTIV